MIKHHYQSNLGRKGFIWFTLPQYCSSSKEIRTGTQRWQGPGGRSRCRSHYEGCLLAWGAAFWLAPHDLLNLPSLEPRAISPGLAPQQWVGPVPMNHSENVLQAGLQLESMKTISQLSSLLSDDSSLCQVDRKLANIIQFYVSITYHAIFI